MRSNKARSFGIFALAILLVFVSFGCVGKNGSNVSYSMNDGAIIKSFSFDRPSVYDDTDIGLTLSIADVGAKKINGDTYVYIYGPPITDKKDNPYEWRLLSSQIPLAENGNYLEKVLKSEEFLPPDPEEGIPGTQYIFYADLMPPKVPSGMQTSYTFYARLCYPYYTTTLSVVTVTSENELRYQELKSTKAETRNSAGPIHIILQGPGNLRSGIGTIPLVFKIINVGKGFPTLPDVPCNPNVPALDRNKVKVSVYVDGNPVPDCVNKVVHIRPDGVGYLYCMYSFSTKTPETEFHILAKAEYKYYVTTQTKIVVKSTPQ